LVLQVEHRGATSDAIPMVSIKAVVVNHSRPWPKWTLSTIPKGSFSWLDVEYQRATCDAIPIVSDEASVVNRSRPWPKWTLSTVLYLKNRLVGSVAIFQSDG